MNTDKRELQYPHIRANIELCRKQLYDLCRGERGPTAVMSVPPRETDFDMQFSAAFDELEAARACVSCSSAANGTGDGHGKWRI